MQFVEIPNFEQRSENGMKKYRCNYKKLNVEGRRPEKRWLVCQTMCGNGVKQKFGTREANP